MRKQRQNNRVEQDVIRGEMYLFGRVLKKLGHKQFEVCFVDAENHFYDKANARIRAKNCALIEVGNIVVMVPDGGTMEIRGKLMSDTVRLLVKEGRINAQLLTAEPEDEGAFEFIDEPSTAPAADTDKEGEIDIAAI